MTGVQTCALPIFSRLMGHVNIMITQRYLLGIKDKDIVDRGTQTSPLMNL